MVEKIRLEATAERERRLKAEAAALAALSMGEALLLALAESGAVGARELEGALDDAVSAHRNAAAEGNDPEVNDMAAAAIEKIRKGLNLASH